MAEEQHIKLSRAAPVLPVLKKEEKLVEGLPLPISSPTIPSIYNKKLVKLFKGRLLIMYGQNTVSEALKRMGRCNVSSIPIVKSKLDNTILGFVDILDLLANLFKVLGEEAVSGGKLNIDEKTLNERMNLFKKTPLSECVNLSGKNPFKVLNGEVPLAEAVAAYLNGVHRIAILDDSGDLVGIISQWTIVNYIATVPTGDKDWIPTLREPLSESHFSPDVISVKNTDITLDCFLKMYNETLSAVAVVDDNEKLVGCLSASDLKSYHMYSSDFRELLKPVNEFLSCIRKKQDRPGNFVIAEPPTTKIMDVILRLNEEVAHRAYVVDEEFHPIGIFTLTDLMKLLIVDTHTISTSKSTAMAQ